MSKKLFHMGVAICFVGCVACTSQDLAIDTSKLQKLGVDYRLTEQDICKDWKRSPKITVTELPAGVVSYDVKMTDLDSPGFRHWNETFKSQEPTIPAGKGANYVGPRCPPNGHRYRISLSRETLSKSRSHTGKRPSLRNEGGRHTNNLVRWNREHR
jgi:phosphatidylethanolamine-binding protein (PEBP) family uncharacterized protein